MKMSLGALLMLLAFLGPANAQATYRNPILYSDYSDPDVIRVGTRYYMTASSFHFSPGLPLLESRDLVHWTLIGHALLRLPFDAKYDLVHLPVVAEGAADQAAVALHIAGGRRTAQRSRAPAPAGIEAGIKTGPVIGHHMRHRRCHRAFDHAARNIGRRCRAHQRGQGHACKKYAFHH